MALWASRFIHWFPTKHIVASTKLGKRFQYAKFQAYPKDYWSSLFQAHPRLLIEKQMQVTQNRDNFENVLPHLNAVANFQRIPALNQFCLMFWSNFLFFVCLNLNFEFYLSFLSSDTISSDPVVSSSGYRRLAHYFPFLRFNVVILEP